MSSAASFLEYVRAHVLLAAGDGVGSSERPHASSRLERDAVILAWLREGRTSKDVRERWRALTAEWGQWPRRLIFGQPTDGEGRPSGWVRWHRSHLATFSTTTRDALLGQDFLVPAPAITRDWRIDRFSGVDLRPRSVQQDARLLLAWMEWCAVPPESRGLDRLTAVEDLDPRTIRRVRRLLPNF